MGPTKLSRVSRSITPSDDEADEKRVISRQFGTIGFVQEHLANQQPDPAETLRAILRRVIPPDKLGCYLITSDQAPFADRSNVPEDMGIQYRLYSPPGIWGPQRFSILRWKVTASEAEAGNHGFLSHCGEEVLFITVENTS